MLLKKYKELMRGKFTAKDFFFLILRLTFFSLSKYFAETFFSEINKNFEDLKINFYIIQVNYNQCIDQQRK